MGTITTSNGLFPHELSLEMFNKVKGQEMIAGLILALWAGTKIIRKVM